MKVFFVVFILCHLFVTKTMASSAYGWFKNKGTEGDDTLGLGVNNTGPNHQYSESGSRRSIVQPTDGCYKQFFVGGYPPTGFRPVPNDIKYICQQYNSNKVYYATMFDERIRIAVYAAYKITHDDVVKIGSVKEEASWVPSPDIDKMLQGCDFMYGNNGQNIERGHLVPKSIYSFERGAFLSTFVYTNAVPQYKAFNSPVWSQYEGKVKKFASAVCHLHGGDLYLMTGTSEAKLVGKQPHRQDLTLFPEKKTKTKIAIPNSMWTAGCCMVKNAGALGGFAAIGNNVQINPQMHQVTVQKLQDILAIGTGSGVPINLFPGNAWCSEKSIQYRYEEGGMHPGWTKV